MDERRTSADFYPGGKMAVPAGGGIMSGEDGGAVDAPMVPITKIDGLPERYTEDDMKSKIDEICKVIRTGGLALAAILAFPAWGEGVQVHGARKDKLYNDDFVVTNVVVDSAKFATTNTVIGATNALAATFVRGLEVATNAVLEMGTAEIATATNALARRMDEKISASTNGNFSASLLEAYAKRTWVEGQGYIKSGEARKTIEQLVDGAIAGLDEMAANRLMSPDKSEWIDGTGVCWRITSHVRVDGVEVSRQGVASEWYDEREGSSYRIDCSGEDPGAARDWYYERTLSWRDNPDDPEEPLQERVYDYEGVAKPSAREVTLRLVTEFPQPGQNHEYPPETVLLEHWLETNVVGRVARTNEVTEIWERGTNIVAEMITRKDSAKGWKAFFREFQYGKEYEANRETLSDFGFDDIVIDVEDEITLTTAYAYFAVYITVGEETYYIVEPKRMTTHDEWLRLLREGMEVHVCSAEPGCPFDSSEWDVDLWFKFRYIDERNSMGLATKDELEALRDQQAAWRRDVKDNIAAKDESFFSPWRVVDCSDSRLGHLLRLETPKLTFEGGVWTESGMPVYAADGDWVIMRRDVKGTGSETNLVFEEMYESNDEYAHVTFSRTETFVTKSGEPYVTQTYVDKRVDPLAEESARFPYFDGTDNNMRVSPVDGRGGFRFVDVTSEGDEMGMSYQPVQDAIFAWGIWDRAAFPDSTKHQPYFGVGDCGLRIPTGDEGKFATVEWPNVWRALSISDQVFGSGNDSRFRSVSSAAVWDFVRGEVPQMLKAYISTGTVDSASALASRTKGRVEYEDIIEDAAYLVATSTVVKSVAYGEWTSSMTLEKEGVVLNHMEFKDDKWHVYVDDVSSIKNVFLGSFEGVEDATNLVWTFSGVDVTFSRSRTVETENRFGLPTHETVTNIVRNVSNSFWDEENQVLWRVEFRGGEPMFVPVTNENVKASGGVL